MPEETVVVLLDPDEAEVRAVAPATLHSSALARILESADDAGLPRPRLESHGDHIFGVLVVAIDDPASEEVHYQELNVIVDLQQIIIVRKTPANGPPYDGSGAIEACRLGRQHPGLALFHIFDEIAEHYLDIVDSFNEEIDVLEDNVDEWTASRIQHRLSTLRHDILHIRRTLSPTRDAARSVLDGRLDLDANGDETTHELFPREIELHFADVYDKLLRAVDGIDLSRDLIAGVRDYHLSKVANNQNEVMKRLTIVASLMLPPTFIVGLYGQNFIRMPELHWEYGYQFSWLLIILSTVGQIIWFRRKKWA